MQINLARPGHGQCVTGRGDEFGGIGGVGNYLESASTTTSPAVSRARKRQAVRSRLHPLAGWPRRFSALRRGQGGRGWTYHCAKNQRRPSRWKRSLSAARNVVPLPV